MDLQQVCTHLTDQQKLPTAQRATSEIITSASQHDMQDIIGQQSAKRALEICAAGNHNLL